MNKTILIPAGEVQSSLALRVSDRLTFNALGNQILERYFMLSRAGLRILRNTFDESELQALLDAPISPLWEVQPLALTVRDALDFNDLATKWQIDGEALLAKVSDLHELEKWALLDFLEFAVSHRDQLDFSNPYGILAALAGAKPSPCKPDKLNSD